MQCWLDRGIKYKVQEAKEFILSRIADIPSVAIVLGSGLSYFAERIVPTLSIHSSEIPHYPQPTVQGHSGQLIFGRLDEVPILAVKGRSHLYEGKTIDEITFPVFLFHELGIGYLILTNAAGAVNKKLRSGDIVILTDFINFTQRQITTEPASDGSYHSPFSKELIGLALNSAYELGMKVYSGVYCWTIGPSYETPAEVAFIREIGGDVVGMSTIPESVAASNLGLKTLGISIITNPAAGIGRSPLSHEKVLTTAEKMGRVYSMFIERVIKNILNFS